MSQPIRFTHIYRNAALACVGWTLIVGGSLGWNIHSARQQGLDMARNEANAYIKKDIAFRNWATSHGGVYVPPTPQTPPNPYLSHIPDRDVVTTGGKQLTLMNPAYMLREMQSHFSSSFAEKGRITSLKPLNPMNAPDEWETRALHRLDKGDKEVWEVTRVDGSQSSLRMMRPFITEKGCLKCHGKQGYKIGDIRGGIDITLSLGPFTAAADRTARNAAVSHGALWLLGLGMIGFFTHRGRRREAERQQAHLALQRLNQELDQRVQQELAKNREKDHLLIQQSRLAAMGEMVHNIAHQWRQPLNALGLQMLNLKDAYEFNELSPELMSKTVADSQRLIQRMSQTIDDFRSFFMPNRKKEPFRLRQAIEQAIGIVEASFRNHDIAIRLDPGGDIQVNGYANEFAQVVLNLLVNAKDAVMASRTEGGAIHIAVEEAGDWVRVIVSDNGGGIPEAALPRMFDPYFTTKEKGSGIGLYMSKMIVEHMGGSITGENADGGARFVVTLHQLEEGDSGDDPPEPVFTTGT